MQALTAAHLARCHAHSAASCSGRTPAAAWAAPPRPPSRRRLVAGRAAGSGPQQPHPEEGEVPEGNSGLQDSLIKQLQFEIGKKRVRRFRCFP